MLEITLDTAKTGLWVTMGQGYKTFSFYFQVSYFPKTSVSMLELKFTKKMHINVIFPLWLLKIFDFFNIKTIRQRFSFMSDSFENLLPYNLNSCSIKWHKRQVDWIKIHVALTCQKSEKPAAGRWPVAGSVPRFLIYAQIKTVFANAQS